MLISPQLPPQSQVFFFFSLPQPGVELYECLTPFLFFDRQKAQNQGSQDPETGYSSCPAAQAPPYCPQETAHPEKQRGSLRIRQAVGQENEGM